MEQHFSRTSKLTIFLSQLIQQEGKVKEAEDSVKDIVE
jgi:hypothetical protein